VTAFVWREKTNYNKSTVQSYGAKRLLLTLLKTQVHVGYCGLQWHIGLRKSFLTCNVPAFITSLVCTMTQLGV